MHTPGDSAMLCRFAHVQSVTFFAHAVVCTVILRRGRGSATFGPGRPRRTPRHRCGGVPSGPQGLAGLRDRLLRAEGSRVAISRAGGPDGTQNTGDAATTSASEGGGRAWPLTTHPRHQCGGYRRDRRAWPGFEPTRRAIGSRRGRRAGGRARRHPEHRRRSHNLVDIRLGPGTPPSTGPEAVCDVSRARRA